MNRYGNCGSCACFYPAPKKEGDKTSQIQGECRRHPPTMHSVTQKKVITDDVQTSIIVKFPTVIEGIGCWDFIDKDEPVDSESPFTTADMEHLVRIAEACNVPVNPTPLVGKKSGRTMFDPPLKKPPG